MSIIDENQIPNPDNGEGGENNNGNNNGNAEGTGGNDEGLEGEGRPNLNSGGTGPIKELPKKETEDDGE